MIAPLRFAFIFPLQQPFRSFAWFQFAVLWSTSSSVTISCLCCLSRPMLLLRGVGFSFVLLRSVLSRFFLLATESADCFLSSPPAQTASPRHSLPPSPPTFNQYESEITELKEDQSNMHSSLENFKVRNVQYVGLSASTQYIFSNNSCSCSCFYFLSCLPSDYWSCSCNRIFFYFFYSVKLSTWTDYSRTKDTNQRFVKLYMKQ